MLRYVLYDLTLLSRADNRQQAEKDIIWLLEGLCQRNQHYLARRSMTPRLYKSGVKWAAPKQLEGDCPEVKILAKALGPLVRRRDIRAVLNKIQDVLGGENFCDVGRILERGEIDCDGLACWRVAELRQAGVQARPFMTYRERPDGTTYHALVIWPPLGPCNYETSEDPSLLLGMYQPERAADRAEEIRKNVERSDIIRRHGRAALRPSIATTPNASFDGSLLDAAVADLLGQRRRVAR